VESKRIVIADDEPAVRLLVSAAISSARCIVHEAMDGQQALGLISRLHPHVAILDVEMPRMTGVQVTEAIRRSEMLKDTRVILLTAEGREADVAAGYAAGADSYLIKPFSPSELLTVLQGLLRTI